MLHLIRVLFLITLISLPFFSKAQQSERWQQFMTYDIHVRLDVETHKMDGWQEMVYYNNSPDTLSRVFFHLYYNAFQPGSMMDVRSRSIIDPDRRVRDRIFHLEDHEIGYQNIHNIFQNGESLDFRIDQTIMEVTLDKPLLPGDSTVIDMYYEAQVPVQIRRTGRDNLEGIAYSMAQWYPRMAEYDYEGWHTHPYVAREFHGVWADYNVHITIDSSFTIGATGYLQNPQEIGHGYEDPDIPLNRPEGKELTWHFYAPNVIDFAWGADPNFVHEIYQRADGPRVHLFYVPDPRTRNWEVLGEMTLDAIEFLSANYGEYPYEQFSVVQGGDGGMEYPMMTLITGHRSLFSLVSVTVHELAHMWYQTWLATNESQVSWMDEGFTVYVQNYTMDHLFDIQADHPHMRNYLSYFRIVQSGLEEPLNRQSDRYETNYAFSVASYNKGVVFLHQLEYIIGKNALRRTMKRYFEEWGGRHPNLNDFKRIAEKESGMVLSWYFDEFANTTRTIDYSIANVKENEDSLSIHFKRNEFMFMPLDVMITFEDGSQKLLYVPTHHQHGLKEHEYGGVPRYEASPWPWTHPEYLVALPNDGRKIRSVEIDPSLRLADKNRLNNRWPRPVDLQFMALPQPSWQHYGATWRPAFFYGENSGFRLGATSRGSYFLNQFPYEAQFMITTGSLDNPSFELFDIDYRLRYTHPLREFGPNAFLNLEVQRYYGIGEERIGFEKRLGRYSILEPRERIISVSLFHQAQYADRLTNVLSQRWEEGHVFGIRAKYKHGDYRKDGFMVALQGSAFGANFSASKVWAEANRTLELIEPVESRFGVRFGGGSATMPVQQRFSVATGSSEDLWRNPAYWSIANMGSGLLDDNILSANSGSGLLGYQLLGVGSPGHIGNFYFAFTFWNSIAPFEPGNALHPLKFEFFSGIGQAWNDSVFRDYPDHGILASLGIGMVYGTEQIPQVARWRSESRVLQNLEFSLRVPFYMSNLIGNDDLGFRLMFGITEYF